MVTLSNMVPSLAELRLLLARPGGEWAAAVAPYGGTSVDRALGDLLMPLLGAVGQLAGWMVQHDPCGATVFTVTWDEQLVMIEARDGCVAVPRPESVHADAELAAQLLTPPATEGAPRPACATSSRSPAPLMTLATACAATAELQDASAQYVWWLE